MNLSSQIHDRQIRDTIQALRFEAGLSKRVLSHLRALERDLKAALADAGDIKTKKRLTALLKEAQATIQERFGGAQAVFDDEIPQFASVQAENARKALNGLVKVDIFRHSLTTDQVKAIASDVLVSGAPSAEWWAAQETDTLMKFTRIVRGGLLRGATGDEMAREVRDMMGVTMRNAQSLVRTSVITVNNAAQHALYDANSDLMKGEQWMATLDPDTCPRCGVLDGTQWKWGEKHPVPSLHFGCRCMVIPVLKSWEELSKEIGLDPAVARELDAMPEDTRASMDGQVAASTTYEEWLKRQSPERIKQALGPARARLYEKGKIQLSDLVDQQGNELTLGQLKAAM